MSMTVLRGAEPNASRQSSEDSAVARRQRILLEALTLWDSIFVGQEKRDLELIAASYARILAPLSLQQLARACSLVLARCRFFPVPVEILELVGEGVAQGLELEAHSAWQALLIDIENWSVGRDAHGKPLPKKKIIRANPPSETCPNCAGIGWAYDDQENRAKSVHRCVCTGPRTESVPELPPATLYALSCVGGYRNVRENANGERGSWIQREFITGWLYFQKSGGLEHPVGKSDAALLGEIERKSGIKLLER